MVAAGAHGTLGQVELTVVVTVAIYWAADSYARLLAARRQRLEQQTRGVVQGVAGLPGMLLEGLR